MAKHSECPVFAALFSGFIIGVLLCVFLALLAENEGENACAKEHNVYQCEGQRIYVPVREVDK